MLKGEMMTEIAVGRGGMMTSLTVQRKIREWKTEDCMFREDGTGMIKL